MSRRVAWDIATVAEAYNLFPKSRGGPLYAHITREVYRADMNTLSQVPRHYFMHLFRWENEVQVRDDRQHWVQQRLPKYLNKPSRCGKYIELLPIEHEWLQKVSLTAIMRDRERTQLVEVGWNRDGKICKVAYVHKIECSGRYFFMCMGMDGGLKTAYITPQPKAKPAYAGVVPYVKLSHLIDDTKEN